MILWNSFLTFQVRKPLLILTLPSSVCYVSLIKVEILIWIQYLFQFLKLIITLIFNFVCITKISFFSVAFNIVLLHYLTRNIFFEKNLIMITWSGFKLEHMFFSLSYSNLDLYMKKVESPNLDFWNFMVFWPLLMKTNWIDEHLTKPLSLLKTNRAFTDLLKWVTKGY